MIHRKMFVARGDPATWTEPSRAFTSHERDEWRVPAKPRQVHTRECVRTNENFNVSQVDQLPSMFA